MFMLSKTNCGAPGEGALPQLDRGRPEGVAQPAQPQPRHPRQQRHPQDCQQNMPKVLTAINVSNIDKLKNVKVERAPTTWPSSSHRPWDQVDVLGTILTY